MENLLSAVNAILITGPTASGKSALAVELAKQHDGVVINADSMQVYDTLRVLTARPSEEDMQGVPHHLYGHVPARRAYSTGAWLRDVTDLLQRLRAEWPQTDLRGRNGSLLQGADRRAFGYACDYRTSCASRLRARLAVGRARGTLSPNCQSAIHWSPTVCSPQDGQRIVRALEMLEATGRSIVDFQAQTGPVIDRSFDARAEDRRAAGARRSSRAHQRPLRDDAGAGGRGGGRGRFWRWRCRRRCR